jgi:hypothetical protein
MIRYLPCSAFEYVLALKYIIMNIGNGKRERILFFIAGVK